MGKGRILGEWGSVGNEEDIRGVEKCGVWGGD